MSFILIVHNLLRWAILVFGIWAVVNAITGTIKKSPYSASDNKTNLVFMICCDTQLLIGLILYFGNSWFGQLKNDTANVMKTSSLRFFAMEHALMMIIAWLLIHVGRSMIKRSNNDAQKHKLSLIFFGIALLIILLMIPWPFRQLGIARHLFPQF